MSGVFITFEGGEGVGKTTQISLLAEALAKENIPTLVTREPGGTPQGEHLRTLLMGEGGEVWSPLAQLLLNSAARELHIKTVIAPALSLGKWVLCDRYIDSTWVYQGYVGKVSAQILECLQEETVKSFLPDLTFILDLDPTLGLGRVTSRGKPKDHYEKKPLPFHQAVRDGFLEVARLSPKRCRVIDARLPESAIHALICSEVKNISF